ncbi:hypothetical protein G7Y79_00078g099920 [Physcia stellaris]|nr:hypothetical protein G7Y79_00078g099920 [Physcia stellaris]
MSKRDYSTFEEQHGASLKSGDWSDFAIICEGTKWQESREGKVDLTGDSPVAVGRMLDYLYTHAIDYGQDFDEQDKDSVTKRMLEILAVYVLGDKYDVPGLRRYCKKSFEKVENETDDFCLLKLVAKAVASIPPNDQQLLKAVIQSCATNVDLIFSPTPTSDTFQTTLEWNNVFREHPIFTTRLLQAVTAQSLDQAKTDEVFIKSLAKRLSEVNLEIKSLQEDLVSARMNISALAKHFGVVPSVPRSPDDS